MSFPAIRSRELLTAALVLLLGVSMAILATVYKGIQIGVESTAGTNVAANKQLMSIGMSRIMPQSEGGMMFRGQGNKIPTVAVPPGKQWSEFDYKGVLDYQTFPYIGCSTIISTTPVVDGTNGKKWTFANTLAAADTKQTYTIEVGNAAKAQKANYCQFNGMQLSLSKSENAISGKVIAGKRQDAITITPTPTQVAPQIVAPQVINVYLASTQAGLAGASVWAVATKAVFTLPPVVQPFFRMASADTTFAALVDQAIEGTTLDLTVGDDTADFGTLLQYIDSGTPYWIRIKALGATISGAMTSQYLFQLDFNGNLITPETPEEEAGAALNRLTWRNAWDTTAGYSFQITNTNTLASL